MIIARAQLIKRKGKKKASEYNADLLRTMILFNKITIESLAHLAKEYKWETLRCACGRSMWGHGYVLRYFSDMNEGLYFKRYRCPDCRTVITTRPDSYWSYLRSSIKTMYEVLMVRLRTHFWPRGFPRQRGGYWLRNLVQAAKMDNKTDLSEHLKMCFEKGLNFLI